MKQELRWSAAVAADARLLWVWRGMWILAAISVGWTLLGHLPLGVWFGLAPFSLGLIAVGWYWRPAAFFSSGNLVIHGSRAHWQGRDGVLDWVWISGNLLGAVFEPAAGKPVALWLTRRRVGAVAWWQLRRELALNPPVRRDFKNR